MKLILHSRYFIDTDFDIMQQSLGMLAIAKLLVVISVVIASQFVVKSPKNVTMCSPWSSIRLSVIKIVRN